MPDTPAAAEVTTPAELSFKSEDFAADIAKLAAEKGVKLDTSKDDIPHVTTPEPKVTPTTPAQPEPTPVPAAVTPEATKPEVPEKFKNPDGTVDIAKVEKSAADADEALAKYLEKEKELKRKINEVKAKENAYINPPAAIAPTPEIPVDIAFPQRLDEDIKAQGAGVVLAKLFTAVQEAVGEKFRSEIDGIKAVNSESQIRMQVEAIGKKDPWVYTPEGVATLTKLLDEQPYMQQAVNPYKAAYLYYKGMQNVVVSQSSPQVLTPTPQARPSAPVPTGQAASQTIANPEAIFDKLTPDQKVEFIKKIPYNEQEKWYIRAGCPPFDPK